MKTSIMQIKHLKKQSLVKYASFSIFLLLI